MELFKVSTQNADEESFKIYSESTLLFTSPSLSDNHVLVLEQCLTASPNYQYTIELLDLIINTLLSYLTQLEMVGQMALFLWLLERMETLHLRIRSINMIRILSLYHCIMVLLRMLLGK